MTQPLRPGLHVAATPIGNLGDVSQRLRDALGAASYVLCEDSRVTGRLMQLLGIENRLRPYHDHNGAAVRPQILDDLAGGAAIVLVSDAGTPLISDPGFKLVRGAREQGTAVFAIPGPCAAIAAMQVAGLPSDRFSFIGFLPSKEGARRALLTEVADRTETLIAYETAPRLVRTLQDLSAVLPDRDVVVGRELTKLHEEARGGSADDLAAHYRDHPPKGEIVLVIGPPPERDMTVEAADGLMREALGRLSLKDAAADVAGRTGLKKRDLYQRWLDRDR